MPRVLQLGFAIELKHTSNKGFHTCGGITLPGLHARPSVCANIPMQRGVRFAFSRSAPMQHGTCFAFLKVPAVQCGTRFAF